MRRNNEPLSEIIEACQKLIQITKGAIKGFQFRRNVDLFTPRVANLKR